MISDVSSDQRQLALRALTVFTHNSSILRIVGRPSQKDYIYKGSIIAMLYNYIGNRQKMLLPNIVIDTKVSCAPESEYCPEVTLQVYAASA